MISKKHFKYFPVLILFLFINISAKSQTRISSPYSYYGLGELQINHSGYNSAMGGIKNAIRSPFYINSGNPASYNAFDTNSFVFDVGLISNFNRLKSSVKTQEFTNYTTLDYILVGIPVARWCGLSVGLIPYSKTGYSVITRDTVAPIGRVIETFQGTGGINQVYIGGGFKLYKGLSIGVNIGYLFGTTYKTTMISTPDQDNSLNIRLRNDTEVSSLYLNYGIQYQLNLNKKYSITLGSRFDLPMKLNAKHTQVAHRYTSNGIIESIKDTLLNTNEEAGKINMPLAIGGGFTFAKKSNWMMGADFDWQNWKNFSSFNFVDSLVNSFNFAIGGEYTQSYSTSRNYLKKISYRMGFHYGQTYLEINNSKINDFSFSIGLGFPISKLRSMINLSVEAGKKGNIKSDLIQENYIKITFGFSFREFWFYRPKLN